MPSDPVPTLCGKVGDQRRRLSARDADELTRLGLAKLYAGDAGAIQRLRGLIRSQLLTATEEILVQAEGLWIGFSVTTYRRDGIVSLVGSAGMAWLIFRRDLPPPFESLGEPRRGGRGAVLVVGASMPDPMGLKILLREVRRVASPRLPNGRLGCSFELRRVAQAASRGGARKVRRLRGAG
jgi:hypothetical protein